MDQNQGFTGGCLCGQVRYVSTKPPIRTVHCYCTDCRRIGGTGHATHTVVEESAFSITGTVTQYECRADSGNLINRRFCTRCGSAIYHTRQGLGGKVVIRASSMDDPELVAPEGSLYAGSAVSWDLPSTELPRYEGMKSP